MGAVFMAFSISASAQKVYTEGVINYSVGAAMLTIDSKVYFSPDSSAVVTNTGEYTAKIMSDNKGSSVTILVDVPVISMKKVAMLTPAEIAQANAEIPKFTFTPTAETKQINGFNCKKIVAKDAKTGSNIDLWITNDIKTPVNSMTKPFADVGGVPVQFTTVQQGQTVNVELKSISADKPPAGTFGVPPGFDKISFADLKKLGGQ